MKRYIVKFKLLGAKLVPQVELKLKATNTTAATVVAEALAYTIERDSNISTDYEVEENERTKTTA